MSCKSHGTAFAVGCALLLVLPLARAATQAPRPGRPQAQSDLDHKKQTNAYWIAMLDDAQADPRRLDLRRSVTADLKRVTIADVQGAAVARPGAGATANRSYVLSVRAKKFTASP